MSDKFEAETSKKKNLGDMIRPQTAAREREPFKLMSSALKHSKSVIIPSQMEQAGDMKLAYSSFLKNPENFVGEEAKLNEARIEEGINKVRQRLNANAEILNESSRKLNEISFDHEKEELKKLQDSNFGDYINKDDAEDVEQKLREAREKLDNIKQGQFSENVSPDVSKFQKTIETTIEQLDGLLKPDRTGDNEQSTTQE